MAELRFLVLASRKGEPVHHSVRIKTEEYGGIDNLDTDRILDRIEHLILVESEQEREVVRDES